MLLAPLLESFGSLGFDVTLFPTCFFAQYPRGGLGISIFLHHFAMAASVTPNSLASLAIGFVQMRVKSFLRVIVWDMGMPLD